MPGSIEPPKIEYQPNSATCLGKASPHCVNKPNMNQKVIRCEKFKWHYSTQLSNISPSCKFVKSFQKAQMDISQNETDLRDTKQGRGTLLTLHLHAGNCII